jgi:hypothetical protein
MNEDTRSEASVVSYSNSRGEDSYVKTVYKLLAHEGSITTSDHIEAVDALCKLQRGLERSGEASRQSQIRLICVVTSLLRRVVRLDDEVARLLHYLTEPDEVAAGAQKVPQMRADIKDLEQTATLVFTVIVMLDVIALGGSPSDPESSFQSLDDAMDRCLWTELCRQSKRRLELPEELQFNEKQRLLVEDLADRPFVVNEESSSWRTVMLEPGLLANSAVRAAGSLLQSRSEECVEELKQLSRVFAQNTSAQMAVQMLKSERDFVTLSTQRIGSLPALDRERALVSIVSAAESESGQSVRYYRLTRPQTLNTLFLPFACPQVLRDMVMSFLLPRKVVGQRRTLLLSREVSARASKEFPWISSLAHEVAMQGAEHVFEHSKSELKRVCALLTGIAMLTTTGTDDTIRKATAFNGLVQLPFLETVPPSKRSQTRLALVPTTRSWTLYTLSASGRPIVEMSQRGFDGLVMAVVCFREAV